MSSWPAPDLDRVETTDELHIAVRRPDGTLRRWIPIWVVRVDDEVFVRTWQRRETGWFGHAVQSGRARIRLHDLEADVAVVDVGVEPHGLRAAVDEAYRAKYGGPGTTDMVTDDSAATTLRLDREN